MPEQNFVLAHQIYAAWNRGDSEWLEEHLADDAQIRPIRDLPEFDELYVGHDGWRRFWETWESKWSGVSVERMEDLEEHGVLVLLTLEGEGGSGYGPMPVTHWLKFREGRLAGLTAMDPNAAERRQMERD